MSEREETINCRLLPTAQVIWLTFVLVSISTVSWLTFGAALTFFTGILPILVIPLVISYTARLKVKVTPDGLRSDNSFHNEMLYSRGSRPWSDLHSVRLRRMRATDFLLERLARDRNRLERRGLLKSLWHRFQVFAGHGWLHQGFIVLDFKSGGIVAFPLGGFDSANLEKLFFALARHADPIVLNPDVLALERDVFTGAESQGGKSFTRMWEDSLNERFEVTSFVPLSGGQLVDGRFTVLMLLACGGMSSVYLVRDSQDRKYILKEMSAESINESAREKMNELFAREAALLARLDHVGIVPVHDSFVANGRNYLVLSYISGLSLKQHVKIASFTLSEVVDIALQICDILGYLHGLAPPVVHRDLTPDNLIISDGDRRITLVDFGAASEYVGRLTGTLIGKQCYIPPEQFQGRASVASDIYAFGCTLYFLSTGQDPEPITTSLLPEGHALYSLVERMTAQDEKGRPEITEVKDYLREARAGKIER